MKWHRSEKARTGEAMAIRKRRRPAITRAAFVLCPLLICVLAGCSGGVPPPAAIVDAPVVTIASVTESATEGMPLEFEVSSDPAPTAAPTVRITLDRRRLHARAVAGPDRHDRRWPRAGDADGRDDRRRCR